LEEKSHGITLRPKRRLAARDLSGLFMRPVLICFALACPSYCSGILPSTRLPPFFFLELQWRRVLSPCLFFIVGDLFYSGSRFEISSSVVFFRGQGPFRRSARASLLRLGVTGLFSPPRPLPGASILEPQVLPSLFIRAPFHRTASGCFFCMPRQSTTLFQRFDHGRNLWTRTLFCR